MSYQLNYSCICQILKDGIMQPARWWCEFQWWRRHLMFLLNNSQFSIWSHHQKVEVSSDLTDLVLRPSQADDRPRSAGSEVAFWVCKESKKWRKQIFIDTPGWMCVLCVWLQTHSVFLNCLTSHSSTLPTCLPSVTEHACSRAYLCI